ncbi:MAG: hypothetical protein WC150_10790 [Bacteroidia bacterium]
MKRYLAFTVILLGNILRGFSCGYSPYGEDIRYSLFLPEYFNYRDFKPFYYNAEEFGFDFEYQNYFESNVYDWFEFTDRKVPVDEINECLNALQFSGIDSLSTNGFVRYLFENKLNDVIRYIITAKKCEAYNSIENEDPWEISKEFKPDYISLLKELNKLTNAEKSNYLKRKYAFITIRTAYYANENNLISVLFEKYFARGKKDYLYYWALFFHSFQKEGSDIDIAYVMACSPEKRYAAYYYFHEKFNLNKALLNAKTNNDIANLYAYASVQRLEPNLDYLKKIYENSNKSRILDFLLLREINKIEDWVYTPYYTNYLPSVEFAKYWWSNESNEIQSTETLRARSEKDRLYAKQVLDFIKAIDYSNIKDVALWKAGEIQLLFITKNYATCLSKIDSFREQYADEKVLAQIEKIKALCIICNQEAGKAIIKKEAKPLILKYLNDQHFLFSMGRELEFRGNLSDGLALIAYGDKKVRDEYYNFNSNTSVVWQGNRLKKSGNLRYFYEYFDYLDFVYNADDLQIVINKLNTAIEDDFYKTVYSQLLADKNYLKDLLGTKYIRENRLPEAKKMFESAGAKYWEENYNSWERDKYDDYYTFDMNPFYDIKYTSSFIPHKDKFVVTKLSVTTHLINYLALADNPKTINRDYYYFIVANCYLNMTQYGHSWMMRRYTSTSDYDEVRNETYIDEMEYRNGNLAQKYYHLAYENAKTDKFKALCIRMEEYAEKNFNSQHKKLKSLYPQYYEDLSTCLNLEEYFRDRR